MKKFGLWGHAPCGKGWVGVPCVFVLCPVESTCQILWLSRSVFFWGVGPVRYMTILVHGVDHFGTTTTVHIGVQLRYTERALHVPFRYIHFGTYSNTGVNNDLGLHGRYIHCESKKLCHFIFTVTLANVGRFLKFFQCRNQKEMAHNKNDKFPTVA